MRYQLKVVKIEPNPRFDPEEEKRNRYAGYQSQYLEPRELEHDAVSVVLTPVEFDAIRKAVLEVMDVQV